MAKKKSQKRIQANIERIAAKEERRRQYEQKIDDNEQGVKRRGRGGYNDGLSFKNIRIIKIVLLVSMPMAFFLYSILLLPIVFFYGLLYFLLRKRERNLNYGMRKDIWITLPKFDCAIALVIVVVVLSIVGISTLATGTANSMYAGKNQAQIQLILEQQGMKSGAAQRAEEIVKSGMAMTTLEKAMFQSLTLLTGQRELLKTVNESAMNLGGANVIKKPKTNNGGSGGGGGQSNNNSGGDGQQTLKIKQPDGSVQTHQGTREELDKIAKQYQKSSGLGNVPLMSTISGTFKTINIILLVVVFAGGLFVVFWKRNEKFA